MRLYVAPNGLGVLRFGVSVSRKCGNAVTRNRLKRLAREAYRRNQHELTSGCDYLLIFNANKPINTECTRSTIDYRAFEAIFLKMVETVSKKRVFSPEKRNQ